MFRLESVEIDSRAIHFHSTHGSNLRRPNQISILTGPNGSGKTEILCKLASVFGRAGRNTLSTGISWIKDGRKYNGDHIDENNGPRTVVAQTFSPFSRFPRVPQLNDKRAEATNGGAPRKSYRPVGVHRGKPIYGSNLSRTIIEQALFSISQDNDAVVHLRSTLSFLNYDQKITLGFDWTERQYEHLALANDKVALRREIGDVFNRLTSRQSNLSFRQQLAVRQFKNSNPDELIDQLANDILLAQNSCHINRRLGKNEPDIWTTIHLQHGEAKQELLLALLNLRANGLLKLESCLLERLEPFPEAVDVADISSGEQQILCSIFGIVTELESNSLLLIDEPELSLHPTWQMHFLDLLSKALTQYVGCHVIIATHSPLIVQQAQIAGYDVVSMRNNLSAPYARELTRTKQSVEGALFEVFGTPLTSSSYVANKIVNLISNVDKPGGREQAIFELLALKELYVDSQFYHDGIIELIDDAVEIVNNESHDMAGEDEQTEE